MMQAQSAAHSDGDRVAATLCRIVDNDSEGGLARARQEWADLYNWITSAWRDDNVPAAPVLEALLQVCLCDQQDDAVMKLAGAVLLWIVSGSDREWSRFATVLTSATPVSSSVHAALAGAMAGHRVDDPAGAELRRRLIARSVSARCSPTPLHIALDNIAAAAVSSPQSSSVALGSDIVALGALPHDCWFGVSDATLGQFLLSTRNLPGARDLIRSEGVLGRIATGFSQASAACGSVVRLLAAHGGDDGRRLAADKLRMFRLENAPPWAGAAFIRGLRLVECDNPATHDACLAAQEIVRGLELWPDTEAAETVAQRYALPADCSLASTAVANAWRYVEDGSQQTNDNSRATAAAVAACPLDVVGRVDTQLEDGVLDVLASVPGVRTVLRRAPVEDPAAAALRLRRLALVHPDVVLRRSDSLAGGVLSALQSPQPHSEGSVRAATALLRVLVAARSEVRGRSSESDDAIVQSRDRRTDKVAFDALRAALSEGRSVHGVHGLFADLALAALAVLPTDALRTNAAAHSELAEAARASASAPGFVSAAQRALADS